MPGQREKGWYQTQSWFAKGSALRATYGTIFSVVSTFTLLVLATLSFSALTFASTVLIIALVVAAGALSASIGSSETRPIELTSLVYLIFFFLLPGLTHQWIDQYPWYNIRYSVDAVNIASLVCLIFLVFFLLGVAFAKLSRGPGPSEIRNGFYDPPATRLLWVIMFLLVIVVISGLMTGYHPFVSRGEFVSEERATAVQLVTSAISSQGSFITLLLSIIYYKKKGSGRVPLLLVVMVPFLAANSPIVLPRFVIGAEILTSFFFLGRPGSRGKAFIVGSLVIAQLTIFPLVSDISRGGGAATFKFEPFKYISSHGDFDGLQSTINVVEYVDGKGSQNGRQITSALLFFVPRPWWPGKSGGLGGDAAKYVGYTFVNISSPLPSELFADFGFWGLIPLSFLAGWMVGRFDRRYILSSARGDWLRRLVPCLIVGYMFIVLRGSLVGVLGPLACCIFLAVVIRWLLRIRFTTPETGSSHTSVDFGTQRGSTVAG